MVHKMQWCAVSIPTCAPAVPHAKMEREGPAQRADTHGTVAGHAADIRQKLVGSARAQAVKIFSAHMVTQKNIGQRAPMETHTNMTVDFVNNIPTARNNT